MSTRDQVKSTTVKGNNPTGKGGFQERPEDRNKGTWDSRGSISFQYNKLMRLSPKELMQFKPETVAQEIALARLKAARHATQGLPDTKEVTDRTEGKAPQSIDMTSNGETIGAAIVFAEIPEEE